jgi:hypothetical protein
MAGTCPRGSNPRAAFAWTRPGAADLGLERLRTRLDGLPLAGKAASEVARILESRAARVQATLAAPTEAVKTTATATGTVVIVYPPKEEAEAEPGPKTRSFSDRFAAALKTATADARAEVSDHGLALSFVLALVLSLIWNISAPGTLAPDPTAARVARAEAALSAWTAILKEDGARDVLLEGGELTQAEISARLQRLLAIVEPTDPEAEVPVPQTGRNAVARIDEVFTLALVLRLLAALATAATVAVLARFWFGRPTWQSPPADT